MWDPLAGTYRAADGWVRLHTNLAAHRRAALAVLGTPPSPEAVRAAVRRRPALMLEEEVVAEGGVAAAMRTREEWRATPQAAALAGLPLIDLRTRDDAARESTAPGRGLTAPLQGLRVLDLTRVIAGPVATRFLAAHGAEVLRVDAPGLDDGLLLELDTSPGKRRCLLDLRDDGDRRSFDQLVADADVLVQSYRPGALDRLGYGEAALARLRPGLVVANLSAYGNVGPWAARRGFDSVVQVATGLAHTSGLDEESGPVALPAQALDHASGYLVALGVIAALIARQVDGRGRRVDVSLARTGDWLHGLGLRGLDDVPATGPDPSPFLEIVDAPPWGALTRVTPPGALGEWRPRWTSAPPPVGAHAPRWAAGTSTAG